MARLRTLAFSGYGDFQVIALFLIPIQPFVSYKLNLGPDDAYL